MLVGVEKHLQERNDHGKHHPHIDHLDIDSAGQALGDANNNNAFNSTQDQVGGPQEGRIEEGKRKI